jgi:hypothetical protein
MAWKSSTTTGWSAKGFFRSGLLLLLPILSSLALLGIMISKVWPHRVPGPKMQIPGCGPFLDLGEGKIGDVLTGHFEIVNQGSEVLTFEAQPGCNCSWLEPAKGAIPPGATQTVRVGVRLRHKGKEELVAVHIASNDPELPETTYQITARCPALVVVRPAALDFGKVLAGTPAKQLVRMETKVGPELLAWTSSSEHLAIRRGTGPTGDAGAEWEVELLPSAPVGLFSGSFTITSPDGEAEAVLPVSALVCRSLLVAPASFLMPASAQRREGCEFTCVVSRFDGEPLEKLLRVEGPEWVTVSDPAASALSHRRLKVRIAPDAPVKLKRTTIRLFFDSVAEPASIEVVPLSEESLPRSKKEGER